MEAKYRETPIFPPPTIRPQNRRRLSFRDAEKIRDTLVILSEERGGTSAFAGAHPLAVIVSNPCPCGPTSRCRSRNANNIPRKPKIEKVHMPSRYPPGLLLLA